ncbi:MAG: glycosyltransferase family 4 protein [Desulfobacterales bacterium]|nr:glycosyltransferase family 4 protein [Desulfobacterales bacterium]
MKTKHCIFLCLLEIDLQRILNPTNNYPYPRLIKKMIDSGEWTVTVFGQHQKQREAYQEKLLILPWSKKNFIRYGLKPSCDLVVMHLFMKAKWAILAKLWHRVPLVYRTGGINGTIADMSKAFYPFKYWRHWVLYRFVNFFISTADGTPVQLHFYRMGVSRKKYREWPNGFRPMAESQDFGRRQKAILYIGRICRVKAVDYILFSFEKALARLDPEYKLVFCGGGVRISDYEGELVKLIEKRNLQNRVEIKPWSTNAGEYIGACKMLLTGCANNQILEAYAMGTPVIALDLGETKDLYGKLDNINIVNYPLGGYPIDTSCESIRAEVLDELVEETAGLMVDLSQQADISPPDVDYDKVGWSQRLDKELLIYRRLTSLELTKGSADSLPHI